MRKKHYGIGQLLLAAVLFLFTLTMLIPLLHILARSLSDPMRSTEMSGLEIIPRGFSLINYQVIFGNKNFVPSIFNSIFITLIGTLLNMIPVLFLSILLFGSLDLWEANGR